MKGKSNLSVEAREKARKALTGKRSFNWRGGRHLDCFGYVRVWRPEHPNKQMPGYILEHRLVMSEHLGRPLFTHETVHHKNGNRADNRIKNLELWTTLQPSGGRVEDKVAWAKEILNIYEGLHRDEKLELLK